MQSAVTYALYGVHADGSRRILVQNVPSFAGALRIQRSMDPAEFNSFIIQNSIQSLARHETSGRTNGASLLGSLAHALESAYAGD